MELYESGEYRAIEGWPYAISAGCVVYRQSDQGEVEILLLVRDGRKSDYNRDKSQIISYHLPKGHCKISELLTETAKRETAEEAGVEVAIITYLGIREDDFIPPLTSIRTRKTVHYFAAQWRKDLQGHDHEHTDTKWVFVDEALELLGAPNPKGEDEIVRRLKKFLILSDHPL